MLLLGRSGFRIHQVIPADRGLPLSDVIYLCKKDKEPAFGGEAV